MNYEKCTNCRVMNQLTRKIEQYENMVNMYYDVLRRLELVENHNAKLVKEKYDRSDRL